METIDQIKIDESGSLEPVTEFYVCSEGYLTFGHGRNFESNPPTSDEWRSLRREIEVQPTKEDALKGWAECLFVSDLVEAERGLVRVIGRMAWTSADEQARTIAINMRFNMGSSFNASKWPNFFRCFRLHDWAGCAVQMRYTDARKAEESKWYGQVDNHEDDFVGRSERLVLAMKSLA